MPIKELCRQGGFSDATLYMYGLPVGCNGLAARLMS